MKAFLIIAILFMSIVLLQVNKVETFEAQVVLLLVFLAMFILTVTVSVKKLYNNKNQDK